MQITVNLRQKCTISGQISLPRVSWKGTTSPINVNQCWLGWGGGCWGEAGHGVGIWHFFKICCQIPCPQANHSSQTHKNFLALISFISVATVREKSGKNEKIFKVREKSRNFSKSQGTLFSGAMHQGWQWAFNSFLTVKIQRKSNHGKQFWSKIHKIFITRLNCSSNIPF